MSVVVFDLDDVICNSRAPIQVAMAKHHGKDISWETWTDYDLGNSYGLPPGAVMEVIIAEQLPPRCEPEPGALAALKAVKDMGHEIVIATARGFYPDAENVTRDWLARHGVVPDHLFVTHHGQKKADVLRAVGPIHAYIDDNVAHLRAMREAGLGYHLVVMDRPWNRLVEEFHRVCHIDEFVFGLKRGFGAAASPRP